MFFFAIWGAFLIRAIIQWSLGLITFWTTRVAAIFEGYILVEMLLSGRVFPLVLMPRWFQTLTWYFPFRWTFSFPIVALTGPISDRDLFVGLGMQLFWILVGIGLLFIVFREQSSGSARWVDERHWRRHRWRAGAPRRDLPAGRA